MISLPEYGRIHCDWQVDVEVLKWKQLLNIKSCYLKHLTSGGGSNLDGLLHHNVDPYKKA